MPSVRQVQVQNLMIQEISDMLYKDLKDPRLGFITITAAEITRDLRYAKVFVSIMGSEDDCAKGLAALRSAAGRIRGEFTRRAHLRVAPEIDFRAVNDRASCRYMKMITPAALLRCLVEGADEVDVDPDTAARARASVQRMIEIGQPGGGD